MDKLLLKIIHFSDYHLERDEPTVLKEMIGNKLINPLEFTSYGNEMLDRFLIVEASIEALEDPIKREKLICEFDPDVIVYNNEDEAEYAPLDLVLDFIIPKRRTLIKEIRYRNGETELRFNYIHGENQNPKEQ